MFDHALNPTQVKAVFNGQPYQATTYFSVSFPPLHGLPTYALDPTQGSNIEMSF